MGYIEVETLALSVDPYMRCRMDGPGHPQLPEYVGCFELGNVLDGAGVGRAGSSSWHHHKVRGSIRVVALAPSTVAHASLPARKAGKHRWAISL